MGRADPLVSVIVPTFNRAARAVEALESVFAQTLADFEVLLVDDGSTDDTEAVVRARFGSDARLRYLRKENGGAASARNRGLDEARGALVAFLDSDDLYLPGHLASQAACLDAHPEADVVVCDARYEGAWKHAGRTVFSRRSFRPPVDLDAMLAGAWVLPSCLAYRRAAAPDVRFDESFRVVEDVEFLVRLYVTGLGGVLNREVLTRYRRLGGQATDDDEAIQRSMLRILEAYAGHARDPRDHRYRIARRRARILVNAGRWREARPHLRTWLRARPGVRPLGYLLASYLRGRREHG